MRVLVTGGSGFTGSHLIRHLRGLPGEDLEVICHAHLAIPEPVDGVTVLRADLSDQGESDLLVRRASPDAVVHLAGTNHGSLADLLAGNVVATANLLESLRSLAPGARVVVAGSSAEYGASALDPIPESAPLAPVGNYGVAKAAQDLLARAVHRVHGLPVAVARPFNLIGPGQSPAFVCGSIVSQVAAMERGEGDLLELAELGSKRDFVDVRDVVAGMALLLLHPDFSVKCAGKVFNIGSGRSHSVAEVLMHLERITGRSYRVELPGTPPPVVVPSQRSDNRLLMETTGWCPSFTLPQSLRDMLAAARGEAARSRGDPARSIR
ncbi:MAG: NAD-dependent epimerase/dehydratase family protein [Methanomicrobiales archaeon]|nr:NAD-dependent epimerase/dehydratase family protein [Methanomicrobiales archaeon]